jgi:hypothetical protein
MLSSCD